MLGELASWFARFLVKAGASDERLRHNGTPMRLHLALGAVALVLLSTACGSGSGSGAPSDGGVVVGGGVTTAKAAWSRAFIDIYIESGSGKSFSNPIAAAAPDGSIFIASIFEKTVDLGAGPLSAAEGAEQVVVIALSPNGTTKWTRTVPGRLRPWSVATDQSGGVWLTGYYTDTVDLGSGPVSSNRPAPFLIHWDSAGTQAFARAYPASDDVYMTGVAATRDGGVVLTGYVDESINFGGGLLQKNAGMNATAFLVRLDASGNQLFAKTFPGSTGAGRNTRQGPRGVRLDANDNILLWGTYQDVTVDLGGGPLPLPSNEDEQAFIARFDANGAHLYSRALEQVIKPVADHAAGGRAILCGSPRAAVTLEGISVEQSASFCARFDANGRIETVHTITDSGLSMADVRLEADASFWMAATVSYKARIGGRELLAASSGSSGPGDPLVLRFDGNGALLTVGQAGDGANQNATTVLPTTNGPVLVGFFSGSIDFGQGAFTSTTSSIFAAGYAP